jgi:protein ImuB
MLWLCLHFAELPLEVFTRGNPEPEPPPRVVVQEHRVALCNPAAREQGIVPGMSTATACALATSLQTLARDCHKEHIALQQLAQWAYRFSPAISIKTPADLLLEVGASLKLFRDLQTVLRQIDEDLCAQGFSYRIGLAHTPKAAWLIARSNPGATPEWFDSRRQKLHQPNLNKILGAMPLRLLDLPAKTLTRLHKPGFRTLDNILALPRPALGKRFGRDFIVYLEQLLGTVPDPQITVEPEPDFRRQLDFLEPIHRSETLLFPMQRLLQELSGFLLSRQLDCPAFNWQLLQQDQDPVDLSIRLSRPRHDLQTFLALTRTRLENIKLAAPVASLILGGDSFTHCEQTSEVLFEQWRGQQQQSMDKLLDKLGARLQPGQIYSLACCDEHVPEMAWRRTPASATAKASATAPARNRPGWLLPSPLAIGHRDNTLYWRGKLKLILGPERIESHWWQQLVKRDYFIALHQDGGFYWVYLDDRQQRWYLHGVFA